MTQIQQDVVAMLDRRNSLRIIGGGVASAWLAGCQAEQGVAGRSGPPPGEMAATRSYPEATATASDGSTCVAFPGETEGPFPADGRGRGTVASVLGGQALQRTDIRTSFGDLTGSAEGVPLTLELQLVDVENACAPLAGRAVYVWHCDAAGRYSLYDLPQQNYLRGLQVADAQGRVRFATIYPGCYAGRFPHVHFEVFESAARATNGREAQLTSQLALPAATDQIVYAGSPLYQGSTQNLARVSLERDNVFADNTPAQVRAQTLEMSGDAGGGYRATAKIGITSTY